MCTTVVYRNGDGYFGRNMDLDRWYEKNVVITPRRFVVPMRRIKPMERHYGMIGMASVVDGLPLYYEATNEKGVSMAGLNFPRNAFYGKCVEDKTNVASFELIPWVLGQCACMDEVKALLKQTNIANIHFSEQLPATPLHWMISDKECSITVESMQDGLKIYDNPFEVLTNNPPFAYHRVNMSNYMHLHTGPAQTQYDKQSALHNYSLGMGALGLPGDYSSASRFVRAFFVKEHSVAGESEASRINQVFHLLNAVAMPKGCVQSEDRFEYTHYSSCCNMNRGTYSFITYDDFKIRTIDMHDVDLDSGELFINSLDREA
ncbi:MAG: choloylglycine hydrolase [Clostridia bacterium]|nr:choloylglycine hydrolase [Clostridia bacterium]